MVSKNGVMEKVFDDGFFMKKALAEAQVALDKGEVPVGVVVVGNNTIIARAHNLTEALTDVTAHAEMQAITAAANAIGGKYLHGCTMYVTLEPCSMCAGALYWSQISRVVFGAQDPKRGYRQQGTPLHPKTKVTEGVLAAESKALLHAFFQQKRD
jgi:tRNA(adenine34) deaminase